MWTVWDDKDRSASVSEVQIDKIRAGGDAAKKGRIMITNALGEADKRKRRQDVTAELAADLSGRSVADLEALIARAHAVGADPAGAKEALEQAVTAALAADLSECSVADLGALLARADAAGVDPALIKQAVTAVIALDHTGRSVADLEALIAHAHAVGANPAPAEAKLAAAKAAEAEKQDVTAELAADHSGRSVADLGALLAHADAAGVDPALIKQAVTAVIALDHTGRSVADLEALIAHAHAVGANPAPAEAKLAAAKDATAALGAKSANDPTRKRTRGPDVDTPSHASNEQHAIDTIKACVRDPESTLAELQRVWKDVKEAFPQYQSSARPRRRLNTAMTELEKAIEAKQPKKARKGL